MRTLILVSILAAPVLDRLTIALTLYLVHKDHSIALISAMSESQRISQVLACTA